MSRFVPIQYRDFWDVPRIFLVEYKGLSFLFDCPFDDEVEDYANEYRVYLLPVLHPGELVGSWANLCEKADQFLGEVPVGRLLFDPSKRKEMDAEVLDNLISQLPEPKQAVGQSSL
jgi:hypothetical protein